MIDAQEEYFQHIERINTVRAAHAATLDAIARVRAVIPHGPVICDAIDAEVIRRREAAIAREENGFRRFRARHDGESFRVFRPEEIASTFREDVEPWPL